MNRSQKTLESDSVGGTFLLTKTTTDTTHLTLFHGERSFVAVGAVYIDQLFTGMHLAHPGKSPGTSLKTLAAPSALVDIYRRILVAFRKCHSIKRAGHYAVAKSKTAEITCRLALII